MCVCVRGTGGQKRLGAVAVIGGMSEAKQCRELAARPAIIVGTPGRLWELHQRAEPHVTLTPHP